MNWRRGHNDHSPTTAVPTTMATATTMVITATRMPMPRRMRAIAMTTAARGRRSPDRSAAQWQTPPALRAPQGDRRARSTRSRPPSSTASSIPPIRSASSGCHGSRSNYAANGAKLNLLRVEIDPLADVGGLSPHAAAARSVTIRCRRAWSRAADACASSISMVTSPPADFAEIRTA